MCRRFFLIALLVCFGGTSVFAASAPAGYALGAYDELSVQVVGVDALSRTTTVLPDGMLEYPLVGAFSVSGHTVDWLSAELERRLRRYLRDPHVAVSLTHQAQLTLLVTGNVKQPGRYPLDRGARLSDAIAAAGGLGSVDGALPDVRIASQAGDMRVISLEKMMRAGRTDLDVPLADRDAVYVVNPPAYMVTVAGNVDHPGQVEVQDGERVLNAVARAGVGANSQADLSHVYVTHASKLGQPAERARMVDVLHAFEHGSDDAYNPLLAQGDAIFVPKAHQKNAGGPFDVYYFLASLRLLL